MRCGQWRSSQMGQDKSGEYIWSRFLLTLIQDWILNIQQQTFARFREIPQMTLQTEQMLINVKKFENQMLKNGTTTHTPDLLCLSKHAIHNLVFLSAWESYWDLEKTLQDCAATVQHSALLACLTSLANAWFNTLTQTSP